MIAGKRKPKQPKSYIFCLLFPLFIFLSVSVALIGCSGGEQNDSRQDLPDSEEHDWDGFYDSKDEKPGFGDPEILAMVEDDPYDDPFDDPFDDQTKAGTSTNAIYIRVLWGNLIVDKDEDYVRDYSGSISIDDGLLVIERTVKFDYYDSEIETREDPTIVAWKSRILPHYDGLVLRLEPGTTDDQSNILHIQIGPYSTDFFVAELSDLLLLEKTGYGDDQIAIASHLEKPEGSGFLSGHWRDRVATSDGIFKGKWETDSGDLLGYSRCRYIPEGQGAGIVRGKYIDLNGYFQGLIDGDYKRTRTEIQSGIFNLDWVSQTGEKLGLLEGLYFKKDSAGYGFALANWKAL